MLTKEQLLEAVIDKEKVELLGDFVWVRGMTGTERDQWEQWCHNQRKKSETDTVDNYRASLVVRTACEENGRPFFDPTELVKVGRIPAKHLDRLYEVGARLSGVSSDDAETLGKNSKSVEPDDSPSS